MEVRNFLQQARENQIDPKHLIDFLIPSLPKISILYQREGSTENPFLARKPQNRGSRYVVAFTDLELAQQVSVEHPDAAILREEATLPFLCVVYRSEYDGILLNPGQTSHLFIEKQLVHQWLTEMAVDQLSQMRGAWVPTKNDSMLLVEYKKKQYTVAIYAHEADAQKMCEHSGGEPKLQSWERIFNKAQKVGADSLFLHFNLAEQFYLASEHVEKIWQGRHTGYHWFKTVNHPFRGISLSEVTQKAEEQVEKQTVQQITQESFQSKVDQPATSQIEQEKLVEPKQQEALEQKPIEVENESVSHDEPVKSDPVKSRDPVRSEANETQQEKSSFPSKRANPYSLKSLKESQLEIHIGGNKIAKTKPMVETKVSETEKKVQQTREARAKARAEREKSANEVEEKTHNNEIPNKGIAPEIVAGLERLEKATIEGQGMANGWEVCQVLAEIRRIWVIVDNEGNMVILAGQDQSPIVDFFSSDLHAKKLIAEAHQNNSQLPPMQPQLVSTKKLYRALSPRQPIVWINRGSSGAWTSVMGDTLPYVLQLMSQMQK
ncbi:hypothetical protein SAMN05444392_102449 [Seinonella peptonophila]|uniref:SseB protein N-terminal domain-containing protein n=1 Tax=Seinonella peptonophila TaxID=112248 RepID=A0A1M4VNR6_9BACL|nr:hypothetical protein [Seinonella peptonophila]SHE70490.1 hypothetical protein SAMN05444392_102449 [Seinonella peptonophila]